MTDLLKWLADNTGDTAAFSIVLVVIIVPMLIGGAIGWVVAVRKTSAEIKNLRAQIIANVGELLVNTHSAQRRRDEGSVRCGRLGNQLIDKLGAKASREDLDELREDLCHTLLDVTIPEFLRALEWGRLDLEIYDASPDEYGELLADAVDELRRFKGWLNVVNSASLLEHLGREPRAIEFRTMRPFLRVVGRFPAHIRNESMRLAKVAVEGITAK